MSIFSENLVNLRLYLKLTQKELADLVGSKRGNITQYEIGNNFPKRDVIGKLAKLAGVEPVDFVNKPWIIPDDNKITSKLLNTKVNDANPIGAVNWMWVPLVSPAAIAGYMSGYSDPEYLSTLPTIPFIIDQQPKGKYIAFKVSGDSMNDGTLSSYTSGDIVMCREIKKDLWRYKLHINDWDFIIVHKTDGVLLKKIIEHDVEKGVITLHSLNDSFKDTKVTLDEVDQLLNIVQVMRKK